MSNDWARERAIQLMERHGPLTAAGARPADMSNSGIKTFSHGIGEWHRRAEEDVAAALLDARTEERKAIAARLREPDEAMVDAGVRAIMLVEAKAAGVSEETVEHSIQAYGYDRGHVDFARATILTIADTLDPSPPPGETNTGE